MRRCCWSCTGEGRLEECSQWLATVEPGKKTDVGKGENYQALGNLNGHLRSRVGAGKATGETMSTTSLWLCVRDSQPFKGVSLSGNSDNAMSNIHQPSMSGLLASEVHTARYCFPLSTLCACKGFSTLYFPPGSNFFFFFSLFLGFTARRPRQNTRPAAVTSYRSRRITISHKVHYW